MKKFTIALDIDDTLMVYEDILCSICREEYGINIHVEDLTDWDFGAFSDEERDIIFSVIKSGRVLPRQRPMKEAVKMLDALLERGHHIMVASSVNPENMGMRAEQLHTFFPQIRDIMLGNRKELLEADFLLDDCDINIRHSHARYPVLLRQPWNRNVTEEQAEKDGFKIVETHQQFVDYVDSLAAVPEKQIVCLVGPSASGKTAIAEVLCEDPCYQQVRTSTTRPRREGEPGDAYYFYEDEHEFIEKVRRGEFLEHTQYAGSWYGMERRALQEVLDEGKKAVAVMDCNGARQMKAEFGEKVKTFYVFRQREVLEEEILARDCSDKEKIKRLAQIDSEITDALRTCDIVISNTESLDASANAVRHFMR